MIKVALLAVGGVCLLNIVKGVRADFVPFLVIAVAGLIMISLSGQLDMVVKLLEKFKNYTKIDGNYFVTLIKMIGIAYVSEFSSGICRDCGYGSIAGQVELFGKVVIMGMSIPIILALLETITLFF